MKTILQQVLLAKKRLLLIASFFIFSFSASAQTTFSNPDTIDIPAKGVKPISGVPYPSDITVSGMSGIVSHLQVQLYGYEHNLSDAVDILLVAPDGSNAVIFSDAGGAVDVYGVDITLDDSAALQLPDQTPITTGVYQPANWDFGPDNWSDPAPASSGQTALSSFYGIDPNGTWSLYVASDTKGAYGKFTGGWSLTITTMRASLLVRFGKFTAAYQQPEGNVLLNWKTEYELGTQSFQVERSVLGGNWTAVADLPAAVFSLIDLSYQYTDKDVPDGKYLYRVKMIAKNGSVRYSSLAFVNVDPGKNYQVYPNPARNYINIRPDSFIPEKIRITLTDINQVVYKQTEGITSKFSPLRLDLSYIKPGTYYLIITSSTRQYTQAIRVM